MCLVYLTAKTQACGSFFITHFTERLSGGYFMGDLFCFNYKVIHLPKHVL